MFLAGTDSKQNTIWHCNCSCGNEVDVVRYGLTSGHTQSCGCLQKERTSEKTIKKIEGNRYGRLTVLPETKKAENGNLLRKCKCDCGNIIYVRTADLTSGHTASCGCLTQSKGEMKIEQLLIENKIKYEREKTF